MANPQIGPQIGRALHLGHVTPLEVIGDLAEERNGTRGPALCYRVNASLDEPEQLLRLGSGLIRGQPAMVADRGAPRTAILAVLDEIDLLAGREGGNAET